MDTEIYALELARRLTRTEVARFRAAGDTVGLDGDYDYHVPLRVIGAGSGRAEQVERALERSKTSSGVPVIVGRHFGQKTLAALNAADANYMDDRHLRVRLMTPSILIRLQGEVEPLPDRPSHTLRLSGAAGGVALALLSDVRRDWKVTDLAAEGCASLGAAQNTVVALETVGLLERVGRGPATRRHVTDPGGLLDLYARDAGADRTVIARGFLLNDGPEDTMRSVTDRLLREGHLSACFTGTAAAQLVAPHVTAVNTFEAWVTTPHRVDAILDAMGAIPAQDGANLIVMRGHRGVLVGSEYDQGIRRASLYRIYADTLADPTRGEEQAEHLREKCIRF